MMGQKLRSSGVILALCAACHNGGAQREHHDEHGNYASRTATQVVEGVVRAHDEAEARAQRQAIREAQQRQGLRTCAEGENGTTWMEACNRCRCIDGSRVCTKAGCRDHARERARAKAREEAQEKKEPLRDQP